MGQVSSNRAKAIMQAQNDVFATINNSCGATCSNTMNGIQIVINDSTIFGNVELIQSCTGNAKCIYDQSVDAVAQALLSSNITQENKEAMLKLFNMTSNDVTTMQEVKNKIALSLNSSCETNVSNISTNSGFAVGTSTVYGSIRHTQEGNANATCAINTLMTAKALADGRISANQVNNTLELATILRYAIIAVAAIVILIVLVRAFKK